MFTLGKVNLKTSLQVSGIVILLVLSFLGIYSFRNYSGRSEPYSGIPHNSPYVPAEISFSGENVPLQYFDVYESLERELIINMYFHSQTLVSLKKSSRYFPSVEPILKRNNVPDDFKYLLVAESGFSFTVSPAGAAGFWQILDGTGKEYGLEISEEIDERYHLEKATEVACKYLLESYKVYNNWTMVAASYNAGRKGIERQIERQGETSYYDLLLNDETARYVFRILAIKIIFEHPEDYGFNIPLSERYLPIPHKLITVTSPIDDMGNFAREQGTNYKMLKFMNPWLRDTKLSNATQKEYLIKIPTSRDLER
jgi:membrane-bound lytic murein transglycosylase D